MGACRVQAILIRLHGMLPHVSAQICAPAPATTADGIVSDCPSLGLENTNPAIALLTQHGVGGTSPAPATMNNAAGSNGVRPFIGCTLDRFNKCGERPTKKTICSLKYLSVRNAASFSGIQPARRDLTAIQCELPRLS